MAKIKETFGITLSEDHRIDLDINYGWFWNQIKVYIDGQEVVKKLINGYSTQGFVSITIEGEPYELRWIWGFWTGKPQSIVFAERDGIILWQYGTDRAIKLEVLEKAPLWGWFFAGACMLAAILTLGGFMMFFSLLAAMACFRISKNATRKPSSNILYCAGITGTIWVIIIGLFALIVSL